MRKITPNYRAFDKTTKQMIMSGIHHHVTPKGVIRFWRVLDPNDLFTLRPSYHYAIMEGTGTNDKHGVEMYEGDIVRTPNGTGVIEWGETYKWGFAIEDGKEGLQLQPVTEFEVLGNIFEHPEALQEIEDCTLRNHFIEKYNLLIPPTQWNHNL